MSHAVVLTREETVLPKAFIDYGQSRYIDHI